MQSTRTLMRFRAANWAETKSSQRPGRELLEWVRRYGTNSCSYVLLEGAKSYFTSPRVDGFLAYQISAGVSVIGGDPVCAPAQAAALIEDFVAAMKPRPIGAYQVSPQMLPAFQRAGFGDVQIGKEAIFDLRRFTLKGGQMELVRAATNKARREGVVVCEHYPFAPGAESVNEELCAISNEWLSSKGEREMGFLLGSLGLERASAKRYFVARSSGSSSRIEGFIVCEPIYGRKGYYLDATRRRGDAVRGTMELLTTEIFRLLADEGFEMASMGLAPLAQLDDPDLTRHPRLTRLMRYVFQQVNGKYDFKNLFRYKAKYHPHAWERRYFCFSEQRLSLRMLYATLHVRNALALRGLARQNREIRGFQEQVKSWKHAASLVVGLLSVILSSSS